MNVWVEWMNELSELISWVNESWVNELVELMNQADCPQNLFQTIKRAWESEGKADL